MSNRKVKIICADCGGTEVVFDSSSGWDEGQQAYVHHDVYDHTPCCNSEECQGAEVEVKTIDLITGEELRQVFEKDGMRYVTLDEYWDITERRYQQREADRIAADLERDSIARANENATMMAEGYAA